jgi:predicted dehydrogenase
MALAAIAAGLHVFCEKPLAATLAEARAIRDAACAAGVVHVLGHQARFAAPFARARELVAAGYLGRLVAADCQLFLNPDDYLRQPVASDSKAGWYTDAGQGGGLLAAAAGPHQVDLLRWCGGPIAAVAARVDVSRPAVELADGTTQRDITAEDAFLVLARFAAGGMATMRGLPIAFHAFGMALDLHGTAGSLAASFDGLRGATGADRSLADLPLPADAPPDRVTLLTRFIAAVRAADPALAAVLPTFDDGVATQAVLAACAEAARTGAWVTVDEG